MLFGTTFYLIFLEGVGVIGSRPNIAFVTEHLSYVKRR